MNEHVTLMIRSLLHPISLSPKIKNERKYSIYISFLIIAMYFMTEVISYQYTGRNFNFNKPDTLNILYISLRTIAVFVLFTAGNWGITTLFEGKATYGEIWVFGSYALIPMICSSLLVTIFTYLLSRSEGMFMQWLTSAGFIWSGILLLTYFMTIHQFTLIKTLWSFAMTIFAMLVMVFIILLFFTLLQHLTVFIETIITEIRFRN